MQAIVQHGYGAPDDVLTLGDVDTPPVGDHEVLVRVRASSANPWDWHFIRGEQVLVDEIRYFYMRCVGLVPLFLEDDRSTGLPPLVASLALSSGLST